MLIAAKVHNIIIAVRLIPYLLYYYLCITYAIPVYYLLGAIFQLLIPQQNHRLEPYGCGAYRPLSLSAPL